MRPPPLRVKGDRLDVRIDLAPWLHPVSADFFRPADKPAFERLRPGHVRGHESEGGVDVSRVESCIRRAERFDFWGRLIRRKKGDEKNGGTA